MSVSTVKKLHVLIIGAGSTGLLIAQGLKKAGISSTVFEKSSEDAYKDRPRHWSMALHWGASLLAKCLPDDIIADIRNIEADPTTELTAEQEKSFPFVNGRTGEVIKMVPSESTRRVSRSKLRKFLSRGVEVRYGKRLKNIEEGDKIVAHFEDGSSAEGDILVGCDGAKSAVRAILLPPEQNKLDPLPLVNAHIALTYTREQALFIRNAYHPNIVLSPHPDQNTSALICIADVEYPDKPETWVLLLNYAIWGSDKQPETNAGRLKLLKSYAANYCEPFKSAAEWIPEDFWVPPDTFRVWTKPVKWDNHRGRVTIAGDAAHPMPPFRGQGLNNAFEDAFNYIEAIQSYATGKQSLEEAVDKCDADNLARGKREIEVSSLQTYGSHHWDVLMKSPMITSGTSKMVVTE
ncbi:FAD/NAD(P)-binding domain-containing protein [Corynespora cassiicola Philippines]|uniref:FAD/NAD(P)-binding domain-containing protein n=1 Tax=Corynespora cassiicola Philippines TaxID=1448308 RepID=A0A2T2NJF5_CORCC|nr:FAD/NAD(P)-binding domain-containing protein [Corynespora cassiicola Philippines]